MHLLLTIIVFIAILSVLVLAHEFGHYYFARRAGVRVDEFGFGLPPRIWSKKVGETLYSLNLFPFGGFVRLFGESASEPGALKNSRSYASKTLRERFFIVSAGVVINILLAVFLLFSGFLIGIKPLLIDQQDVLTAIQDGQLLIKTGHIIKSVEPGSLAERMGIQPEDVLVEVNSKSVITQDLLSKSVQKGKDLGLSLKLRRGDSLIQLNIPKQKFDDTGLGIGLYESFMVPRISVQSVDSSSEVAKGGIHAGDILLALDGTPVYTPEDYQSLLTQKAVTIRYERQFKEYETTVTFPQRRSVVVSEVVSGSGAEKAELKAGDSILQVQRQDTISAEQTIALLNESKSSGQPAQLLVERAGKTMTLYLSPGADGTFGVRVSPIINQNLGMVLESTVLPTTMLELKAVRYGFFKSLKMSLTETYRLAGATIGMFGSLIGELFTSFSVPDGVSGPVGIAQMTGVFVAEGLLSLLRFMALLSLSLGILNLLPFPGLDGGRLLFIIIEGVLGRPVNQKFEQAVHGIGAICLIVIIFAVTYKDIVRLF